MIIPATVPPLPKAVDRNRNLPLSAAFLWLKQGWHDLWIKPIYSLLYGLGITVISMALIAMLFSLEWDAILFPALAGFLIMAPALAIGLYEKSRCIAENEPITFKDMLFPRTKVTSHILFVGAVLFSLVMLWIRSAVMIYALYLGWQPFLGLDSIIPLLFTTPLGWGLLVAGSAVGALFAGFGFAISAFSIPMLLEEKPDAFTAMGLSISLVWNNLGVMLVWGAIVLGLTLLGMLTGLLGLIIIYPLLGHATWHAYQAIKD